MSTTQTRADRHRPKHPKGVSPAGRVAGVLGEILITLGILVGLFVLWQVWWTDVIADRQAEGHMSEWEAGAQEAPDQIAEPREDDPEPPDPAPEGDAFAIMYVPRWGEDWRFPIASGTGYAEVLDNGFIGHFPDTEMPGELGNFALAGHRQSYGRPFYSVDNLQPGDPLVVRTENTWYVYRVTDHEIVTPTDVDVLAPVPREPEATAEDRMITLVTCHPLWSVAERYIVYGELDYWADVADGRPAELDGGS